MALPVNIEQLLNGNIVEWERLDFKQGWNPEDVMHTMCAFANDMHNWGGGYIICGIAEKDGRPVLPPAGLDINQMDKIQKELVQLSALIQPTVNYVAEPIVYQNKNILILWIPGGDNRPYKAPTALGKEALKQGRRYYIRKGSVTCIADAEDERRLLALTNKIPFDDRICHQADLKHLSKLLIADFLQEVGSSHNEEDIANMTMEQLGWDMQIIGGTSEYLKPKNVGVLFFTKDPEQFIPGARIEIVRYGKEPSEVFEEKILHGPIHKQLTEALEYLKNQIIVEKVQKVQGQAPAKRAFNYPYEALEEIVCNAVYHKSWDDRNPIEINIYADHITIFNIEGPVPPLTNADMQKEHVICRNYRNRRIGDLLKELDLTEGRNTGFPKIYREIRKNGSPLPIFETDEHNMHFMATLPIHEMFFFDEGEIITSTDKEIDTNFIKGFTIDQIKEKHTELTDRQAEILHLISLDNAITSQKISHKNAISSRTIIKEMNILQQIGILHREGSKKEGVWIVTI